MEEVVAGAYKQFSSLSQKGSLGIDCSGFVCASYLQDQQLLFDAKALRTGSGGQLGAFRKAAQEGNAYVHRDFNLISAGDFIQKPGHVMIATGSVHKDAKGNVTEFETYEANSTDVGSVTMWRKVNSSYTIGHPFRTSDTGGLRLYGGWGVHVFKNPTPSSDPKTRTRDNLQQTVKDKKNP